MTGYCLRAHHTFALPIYTRQLITVNSLQSLQRVRQQASRNPQPLLFLGEGSNTLFCEDFQGSVIVMRIGGIQVTVLADAWLLHIGAGANWHSLVQYTLKRRMPGLENLALIPGSVGAAAIQNIGAYGVEFKKFCCYVDLWDLANNQPLRLSAAACGFGYRDSALKQHHPGRFAVVAVGLTIAKKWQPTLTYGELSTLNPAIDPATLFATICTIRRRKLPDPRHIGNAGSFFKNPVITTEQLNTLLQCHPQLPFYPLSEKHVKVAAGWLIETLGLKGHRIGDAAVHPDQALVLVNLGAATPSDVITLARSIRHRVADHFDINLTPEVCFIGASGHLDPAEVLA